MVATRVAEANTRESFLPRALPSIGDEGIAEVVDSLRSDWITTGPKAKSLKSDFAVYVGSKHAIAVNSCTAGLHIALTGLGVDAGDEVIVPTLTFCSTANVLVHLGARPVLVDVGQNFNVTPEAVEAAITPRTKAIKPVHYSGQSCDLDAICALGERYSLPVVEDAAHAIGATYNGHKIGSDTLPPTRGEAREGPALAKACPEPGRRVEGPRVNTIFSFYAIKNMTTGEGGMITTADDSLAERMRLLTLHGMSRDAWKRYTSAGSWYYEVVLPGYKANMTDIQAALGIHQLRRLDDFVATRQRYARLYDEAFADLPEVETPVVHPDRTHAYHLYVIRLQLDRLTIDRTQFIEAPRAHHIGTSVHFIPVHIQPFYRERLGCPQGDLPRAEMIYERILSLPLYPTMSEAAVHDVIQAVRSIVTANRG